VLVSATEFFKTYDFDFGVDVVGNHYFFPLVFSSATDLLF